MVLLAIPFFIIIMVAGSILNGWVLSVLWEWFFVPTLGLPTISIAQAIGIGMVVSFLTYQHINDQNKDATFAEQMTFAAIMAILRPFFALVLGWVIQLFM